MPVRENGSSNGTEYVESFERLKRKNTVKRIKHGIVYAMLMLMLILVFACIVAAVFFRIGKIEVKGDSLYSEQEIIDASGIQDGDNIFLIDKEKINESVTKAYPLVKNVRVIKSYPSTVKLEIECDVPSYYVEIDGEYFLLSDRIRILAKSSELEELIAPYTGVKKLKTAPISRAVVGEKMTFKSNTYSETLESLLNDMSESDVFTGITSIDVSDKFNISAVYEHRLKALLGNISDMGVKLLFLNGIINDLGNSNGTIDIKDAEIGYVLLSSDPVYD